MIFNKKAQAREKTVKIIALLVTLIVLFLLVWQTAGYFIIETKETGCKLSVSSHSLSQDATFKSSAINCPRNYITFYEDRVEKNGEEYYIRHTEDGDVTFEREFEVLKDDIVQYVFAQEMAKCWEAMGQGELDVFADPFITFLWEVDNPGRKLTDGVELANVPCLIWATAYFDDDIEEDFVVEDFLTYVKEEYPVDLGKGQETYYEYIFVSQEKTYMGFDYGDAPSIQIDDDFVINSDETYHVYFRGADGFGPDGVASKWYSVYVGDIDHLKQHCDYIYN